VAAAVDLDAQPPVGPVEVHLDAVHVGVDERLVRAPGAQLCEERVLEVAPRAGAAAGVRFERGVEHAQPPPLGARHGRAGRALAEPLPERGLVDDVRELLGGQAVREVDQGAGDGGDRDAVAACDVARIEVPGSMHVGKAALTGTHHFDRGHASSPDLPQLRRREMAQRRSLTGLKYGPHPTPLLGQARVPDRVHRAAHAVQPTRLHTSRHRRVVQPGRAQLRDRHKTVLAPGDHGQPMVGCVTKLVEGDSGVTHPRNHAGRGRACL
jgi:hypothetical protein